MENILFRTINVGVGSLTVTGQGKVLTYSNTDTNVSDLVGETWNIQSGIVGYYAEPATAQPNVSDWNAIVGEEVTLPDSRDLTVPLIVNNENSGGANEYSHPVTVLPNGNPKSGAGDPEGNLQAATFRVGETGSYVR